MRKHVVRDVLEIEELCDAAGVEGETPVDVPGCTGGVALFGSAV